MRQASVIAIDFDLKEEDQYKLKIRELVFLLQQNPDYRKPLIQRAVQQVSTEGRRLFLQEIYNASKEYPDVFKFLLSVNLPLPEEFVYPVQDIDFEKLATELENLGPVQRGFLLGRIERSFLVQRELEYFTKKLLNTVVQRVNGLSKPLRSKTWEVWSWVVTVYAPWLDLDSGTSSVPDLKLWTLPYIYPTKKDRMERRNSEALVFPSEPTEENINFQTYFLELRLRQLHEAEPGFFPQGIRKLLENFNLVEGHSREDEREQRIFLAEYLRAGGLPALASKEGIDFLLNTVK